MKSPCDIAPLPAVLDPERRESCRLNLRAFLDIYHHVSFPIEWSGDHLAAIAGAERTILYGDYFSLVMERGTGKTTILCKVAEWAALYGHVAIIYLLREDNKNACGLLTPIRTSLQTNPFYLADFPEVAYPIRCLEAKSPQRRQGQLCAALPTKIRWADPMIILPTIAGSAASGVIIHAFGWRAPDKITLARYLADDRPVRAGGRRLILVDGPHLTFASTVYGNANAPVSSAGASEGGAV